jgi:RNA polymerase sigma-70 factor (ECF subfamily)
MPSRLGHDCHTPAARPLRIPHSCTTSQIVRFDTPGILLALLKTTARTFFHRYEGLDMDSRLAFEREALPQIEALYSFALQLCHDREDSNDLVQETLLKAYRYFDSYRQGTNCRAWLFQICKHAYINHYRRMHLEPIAIDFAEDTSETETFMSGNELRGLRPSLRDEQDVRMHSQCLGDEVIAALRLLPRDYQTAVILSDIEGHSYEEIAAFMQVPIGTIRSRIHRGRKILAAQLAGYARDLRWAVVADAA